MTLKEIAEKMTVLAYKHSIPMGMGWLHERDNASDAEILRYAIIQERDSRISVSNDYMMGRMVKLGFKLSGTPEKPVVEGEYSPRSDYQSWAACFPSYDALLSAVL